MASGPIRSNHPEQVEQWNSGTVEQMTNEKTFDGALIRLIKVALPSLPIDALTTVYS